MTGTAHHSSSWRAALCASQRVIDYLTIIYIIWGATSGAGRASGGSRPLHLFRDENKGTDAA
eukprot:COSAG01_NODE_2851_length_6937_cov_13.682228_6_plen_62_part_00